jgi:uncharacterized C2H2 Zn-finger protein
MKWVDKISIWEKDGIQNYPSKLKKRFFYETSFCMSHLQNIYKEKFIENNELEKAAYNPSSFQKYIESSKNKYVTSFPNLSGDSLLIIPIPRKGKDFTTMKDFIDNASQYHQKIFWKKVAKEIKKRLKEKEGVYVSTHGLGIPYFHIRLDDNPKYYQTNSFKS